MKESPSPWLTSAPFLGSSSPWTAIALAFLIAWALLRGAGAIVAWIVFR